MVLARVTVIGVVATIMISVGALSQDSSHDSKVIERIRLQRDTEILEEYVLQPDPEAEVIISNFRHILFEDGSRLFTARGGSSSVQSNPDEIGYYFIINKKLHTYVTFEYLLDDRIKGQLPARVQDYLERLGVGEGVKDRKLARPQAPIDLGRGEVPGRPEPETSTPCVCSGTRYAQTQGWEWPLLLTLTETTVTFTFRVLGSGCTWRSQGTTTCWATSAPYEWLVTSCTPNSSWDPSSYVGGGGYINWTFGLDNKSTGADHGAEVDQYGSVWHWYYDWGEASSFFTFGAFNEWGHGDC